MNKPITRERLKRYRYMIIELNNQVERVSKKRGELESPAAVNGNGLPAKRSHAEDRLSVNIAHIVDLEKIISENIRTLAEEIVSLENAVQRLEDPCEREIIRLRYFECRKWNDIGHVLHFETTKLGHVHSRALHHLYENSMA